MGRIIGDYHIVIRQLILCYITTSRLLIALVQEYP